AWKANALAESYRVKFNELFQMLNLDAEQREQMVALLVGRQLLIDQALAYLSETRISVAIPISDGRLGRSRSGMGNTADLSNVDEIRSLAVQPIETEIRQLLGDDAYNMYADYI